MVFLEKDEVYLEVVYNHRVRIGTFEVVEVDDWFEVNLDLNKNVVL